MEQGTLGELYLTRSVTKHIRKHNKSVAVGAGVGKDYSLIKASGDFLVQSEGLAETPYIAWVKAINNFSVSGGEISGVRVCYMLPVDIEEETIKLYASQFNALAEKYGIQIIGGNTRVSSAYSRASFLVQSVGTVASEKSFSFKAHEDYQIVMVGYTAMLGTNLMVEKKGAELKKRFAPSYVEDCRFVEDEYFVMPITSIVNDCKGAADVVYMHDVSYGGIYGGLWQLGQALNMGVDVAHNKISIRQETVEICNYFDINPYMCDGTGALLVVAKDGKLLEDKLSKAGYVASVLGRVTKNRDRIVVLNKGEGSSLEKRFLAPVKGDEIYKVISAY